MILKHMKIREMKEEDLEEIAKLFANEYAKPPYDVQVPFENTLASVKFFFKRGAGLVAEKDNVVGALIYDVQLYQKGKVASIKEFVVNANYQGQGIGKKLLQAYENMCDDVFLFKLGTNRDAKAVRFYEKLGYKTTEGSITMVKTSDKP